MQEPPVVLHEHAVHLDRAALRVGFLGQDVVRAAGEVVVTFAAGVAAADRRRVPRRQLDAELELVRALDEVGRGVRQRRVDVLPVFAILDVRVGPVHALHAGEHIPVPGRAQIPLLRDVILVDLDAAAFHVEQCRAVEDVAPLRRDHRIDPDLDARRTRRDERAGPVAPPVAAVVVVNRERILVRGPRVDFDEGPPDARLVHRVGRHAETVRPLPANVLGDVLEPELVLHDRPAERVVVVEAVIGPPRELLPGCVVALQGVPDPVERPAALELVAARLEDQVDHAALEPGILGRRTDRLDLHFLHHVEVRPVERPAERRRGHIEAVVLKRILVAVGPVDIEPAARADVTVRHLNPRCERRDIKKRHA